ncbi:FtsX-like permease family protein [Alteromonadaceae bacterium M269]|nr:FtsX-like permease family protein [Alteromonadaceae bacterium M269]
MNNYKTLIIDAISELSSQKLRTFLTLLGMIFGVGAVIAMLNIGEGAEKEALALIDSMGVNNIIVESKQYTADELKELREESLGLSLADSEAAVKTLPFVTDFSASKHIKVHDIYSDWGKSPSEAMGITPSYFEHGNLTLSQGRFFDSNDDIKLAQVVVLGFDTAKNLFPNNDPIGQFVKINHLWLEVIGVLSAPAQSKDEFQGVAVGGDRNRLFIPLLTSMKKLKVDTLDSQLDTIKLSIDKQTDPIIAASAISHLIKQRHGDVDDFTLLVPAALLEQQKQTQQIFNIVMACVAGISLLVGGIGIMNIMLANVLERTREIGLLRAVGATQKDIKQQFIAESFTISILGGILGVLFGQLLAALIGFYSGWAVSWSIPAIVLALGICMLVGVGFGVFPAIKASKLNPIDALHSD